MNYFKIFDLKETYDLDLHLLEEKYFIAQQQHHPDKNINKTDEEKEFSLEQTVVINEAYKALKEDVSRANHLMEISGVKMDCASSKKRISSEVLIEAFEDGQKLDYAESENMLDDLHRETKATIQLCKQEFDKLYSMSLLNDAALVAIRMRYKVKLIDDIKAKK